MSEDSPDMALIMSRLDDLSRRLDAKYASPWFTSAETAAFLRA